MKRVFISQAFHRHSEDYIMKVREVVKEKLEKEYPDEEIEIVDQYHQDEPPEEFKETDTRRRLWYLSNSIKILATCDFCVFVTGHIASPGCCVEKEVVKRYGINYMFIPVSANELKG